MLRLKCECVTFVILNELPHPMRQEDGGAAVITIDACALTVLTARVGAAYRQSVSPS